MRSSWFLLLTACDGAGTVKLGDTAAPDSTIDSAPDTDPEDTAPAPIAAEGLAVTVHPEIATILVASWTQLVAGEASLSWELDGETHTSPPVSVAVGAASEVVLGLPEATGVTVTLHVSVDGEETTYGAAIATTGALPDEMLRPVLTLLSDPDVDPAPYFLTSVNTGEQNFFGPCHTVIVDRQGRVVWYRETADRRLTLFPRVARDGTHILWDATTYYVTGVEPSITRATLTLDRLEETTIPAMGFTWDELPDGGFIYDEAESPYLYHLTRRGPDGAESRVWSCAPWMNPYNTGYWACAANTAHYDAASNVVVWSMFQTSTVLGIDLTSGELLWELGEYPGGLGVSPESIRLELQHFPNWTPDGTLLLTTHVPGGHEQHIREFALDIGGNVATQVWDYAPEAGYYGDYAGEATRLPNGNTLVNFGTDGVLQEVTPAGDVVWEVDWRNRLLGHLTPLDDLYALDGGR